MIKKKPLSKKKKAELKKLRAERKKLLAENALDKKILSDLIKKDVADQTTLLSRFMKEKYLNYKYELRKPSKGTKGFGIKKYAATLYGLTNFKNKVIAKDLKISHGLLRKWRTEEPFKKLVIDHCSEFITSFINHISSQLCADYKIVENLNKKTIQELYKLDHSHYWTQASKKHNVDYDEMLSDMNNYSTVLTVFLYRFILEEHLPNIDNEILRAVFTHIFSSVNAFSVRGQVTAEGEEGTIARSIIKAHKALEMNMRKDIINNVLKTILKPKINVNDKKSIIINLKVLESNL